MKMIKQVGALPIRQANAGALEVLLITSRDTGRWVIPKGWPSKRLKSAEAAAREAEEEAGVVGKVGTKPVGSFEYFKRSPKGSTLISVKVFLIEVRKERKRWPEQHDRERAWFSAELAATMVQEQGLRALIETLVQRDLEFAAPPAAPKYEGIHMSTERN
jgi:8-oxo-dGTP pyrophosphatase MutT (NUDIX family)